MSNNEKRQSIISMAMFKHKVTKKELAEQLGMSYPTMLSKLKNTGSLYISEADNLCSYLNIDLNELITLKN
jgi:DNA-binding Xre family transcriptional regulator|tara:strand:- start:354 stop:566 length:213 start_codon:yes stop_codon:yes gene_type:complete